MVHNDAVGQCIAVRQECLHRVLLVHNVLRLHGMLVLVLVLVRVWVWVLVSH